MAETSQPRRSVSPWSVLRLVAGVAALAVAGAGAVLFTLGSWNPWGLVVLEYQFGNPMVGLLVVPLIALVGFWLALPVHNEVKQPRRITLRVAAGVLAVIGLFGWGLLGDHFAFDAEEITRSDDGAQAVAIVRDRATNPTTYLRLWHGSGLTAREVADLGRICGSASAQFLGADAVELRTPYGTWQIDLHPDTGLPQQVLGPGCTDGPVPVAGS